MRVAIYARVSTEIQEAKGTIGSQLAALNERARREGHQVAATFRDEGHSGARLDRPGLDALRDQAEAGLFEAVWCLSPDRLARAYAYQVLVLDELARHGVRVLFADAPALDDDPQARLLTQVQGVIAEYERAKIAERNRRGKLWRARAGEVITWKAPYGYRRISRVGEVAAHLEIYEPEAAVVRRIFDDRVRGGQSIREIARRLNADGIASPSGQAVWSTSTISGLLRNQVYVGRLYYNQTEATPDLRPGGGTRQRPRPKEEWIAIPVPALVSEEVFEAAERVGGRNAYFSARRTTPGLFLLRGLVRCGHCGTVVACHQRPKNTRKPDGPWNRYYYCRHHDSLRAGGEDRRCPERAIRADALDSFVYEQIRDALLRPDVLVAGEHALTAGAPAPDDEIVAQQLRRLKRKTEAAAAEQRRLIDVYQAGLIELDELRRRAAEIERRQQSVQQQEQSLRQQHRSLSHRNQLRTRIADFVTRVNAALDTVDFQQRQELLRLVLEDVTVTGWNVHIRLRIPLDQPPDDSDPRPPRRTRRKPSREERLRSLRIYGLRDGHIRCLAPGEQAG
jgi:site-specific DNA recombinase